MKIGLTGDDFDQRTEFFGNNYRPPLEAKSWISIFLGALDDFMLKVLIFSAIIAITFDMLLAKPEDRSHGKFFFYKFLTRFKPGLRDLQF